MTQVRSKFRFSIRGTLASVAVIAILVSVTTRQARIQKRVVDRLTGTQTDSGSIWYHHETRDTNGLSTEKPGPDWLRRWMGDHYFLSIHRVMMRATPSLIQDIAQLESVEGLIIDARLLTDPDALCPLAKMQNLQTLRINHAFKLATLNLECLRSMTSLRRLELNGIKIEDDALEDILAIEPLRYLSISQTYITPEAADTVWDLRPEIEIHFRERVISPSLFP